MPAEPSLGTDDEAQKEANKPGFKMLKPTKPKPTQLTMPGWQVIACLISTLAVVMLLFGIGYRIQAADNTGLAVIGLGAYGCPLVLIVIVVGTTAAYLVSREDH